MCTSLVLHRVTQDVFGAYGLLLGVSLLTWDASRTHTPPPAASANPYLSMIRESYSAYKVLPVEHQMTTYNTALIDCVEEHGQSWNPVNYLHTCSYHSIRERKYPLLGSLFILAVGSCKETLLKAILLEICEYFSCAHSRYAYSLLYPDKFTFRLLSTVLVLNHKI